MIKRINKYSKSEQAYINYRFRELKNNFPKFILYEVYNQDKFQYIELKFLKIPVEDLPTETNPWEDIIKPETDFKRIFQIIANKFNIHYHDYILSINYNDFIIKFKNYQPLAFFQYINITYNLNLRFTDNIINVNILSKKDKILTLIFSAEAYNQQLSTYKTNIISIDINQINKLKHQYPLINTNILFNFIIRKLYK